MNMHEARQDIRQLVEDWAIWRDTGDFRRLRAAWHDDGVMVTTWQEGKADDFIAAAEKAWANGLDVTHVTCGTSTEIAGRRAVAQTRTLISQRARVHDVEVDIECTARFYDLMERRDGRWAICLRHPIYDRDRMIPIDSSTCLNLDRERLQRFPVGYRHLAYAQSLQGIDVRTDLPGRTGAAVEALYARGREWLG